MELTKEQQAKQEAMEKVAEILLEHSASKLDLDYAMRAPLTTYLILTVNKQPLEKDDMLLLLSCYQLLKNEIGRLQAENAVLKAQKTPTPTKE